MSSVGYEAFQGKRRKTIALLCFMLSSAIIASTLVFVDSYSLATWYSKNDVGPVALVATGVAIHSEVDNIRGIDGVSGAAAIRGSVIYLASWSQGLLWQFNSFCIGHNEEFVELFPTIFTLTLGRFPENTSEIAISALAADRLYIGLGDQVNYSFESINPYNPSYRPSIVSGIFVHGEGYHENPYFYVRWHVLCHSSIGSSLPLSYVYADVDRSKVVPHDPRGSLDFLNEIDEEIRLLDPVYRRGGRTEIAVSNFLSEGIEDYMSYLTDLRTSQILRSGGIILLELAVIYLVINHIWNEREYEVNMLIARGASRFRVAVSVNLEIIMMALLSIIPGFVIGVVASRVAMASDGFFSIDLQKVITEPFLVTYDGALYSIIAGLVLPLMVLGLHQMRGSVRITTKEPTGRLARITKALSFIRGDVVILALSVALLVALNLESTVVKRNPLLYSILGFLPYTMFFGMTSLMLKGLRRGANFFSRGFSVIVGKIPSAVGIRRISKATVSSGPLILVLVLSMSLGWNYAINDATLPYTVLNQSRFAIGGDLAF
ncbi:MAG: hypothetical protein PVJ05_12375, partial [Candidatus Thorarchaeota archaeon]